MRLLGVQLMYDFCSVCVSHLHTLLFLWILYTLYVRAVFCRVALSLSMCDLFLSESLSWFLYGWKILHFLVNFLFFNNCFLSQNADNLLFSVESQELILLQVEAIPFQDSWRNFCFFLFDSSCGSSFYEEFQ